MPTPPPGIGYQPSRVPPPGHRQWFVDLTHYSHAAKEIGDPIDTAWVLRNEAADLTNEIRRWEWEVARDPELAEVPFKPLSNTKSCYDWRVDRPTPNCGSAGRK